MVIAGEIGAGRTTLIHKLLREPEAGAPEAALLVSRRLEHRQATAVKAGAAGAPMHASRNASSGCASRAA